MMIEEYKVPCVYPVKVGSSNDRRADEPENGIWFGKEGIRAVVPGSKSMTNRALLLAVLARGESELNGVLFSQDSRYFLSCVQELGFDVSVDESARKVQIQGLGGKVPRREASLYVGSAGTAARFLTAYLGISNGVYHMDASEQMRRRPMAPLLEALERLGCEVGYSQDAQRAPCTGHFPFELRGHGFCQDHIRINIEDSSQFLSGLLMCSCLAPMDFEIMVEGNHGMSYIDMTIKMMEQFGVKVILPDEKVMYTDESTPDSNESICESNDPVAVLRQEAASPRRRFKVASGQYYRGRKYAIEADVSAACYFYAMAPLLEVSVLVRGVHADSLQGDLGFIRILEQMGCASQEQPEGILLLPPSGGSFSGVDVDMSACSDQAITLAAIAPYADSPTTIRGIGHIKHQECDRMAAIVAELTRAGIICEATEDELRIIPGKVQPATIETYDDHRMAMGFALLGLRTSGITILNPSCCSKTFENYFEVMEQLFRPLG
jgi:3-phosphoshikimate 1-carboxyvinyltransferase